MPNYSPENLVSKLYIPLTDCYEFSYFHFSLWSRPGDLILLMCSFIFHCKLLFEVSVSCDVNKIQVICTSIKNIFFLELHSVCWVYQRPITWIIYANVFHLVSIFLFYMVFNFCFIHIYKINWIKITCNLSNNFNLSSVILI